MASYKVLAIFGCILVNIIFVIQSAPVDKTKEVIQTSAKDKQPLIEQALLKSVDSDKSTSTTSSPSTSTTTLAKKKRYIDDNLSDELFDSDSDDIDDSGLNNNHILHTKVQETSATIHDNADKLVDTDDSKVFSDIKMTPSDLSNVRRRRRDVQIHDQFNQRHKRALSPYEFYETDSLYEPYADLVDDDDNDDNDDEELDRPMRSFAPIYWYPRHLRSVYLPSFDEYLERPRLYSSTFDEDDDDDNNEENLEFQDDSDIDYEPNEYPILLRASDEPIDLDQYRRQDDFEDIPFERVRYENNDDNFNTFDVDDDEDDELTGFYSKEHPLRFWII